MARTSTATFKPTKPAKTVSPTKQQEDTMPVSLCQNDRRDDQLSEDVTVPATLSIANLSKATGNSKGHFCRLYDLHVNLSDIGWTDIVKPQTLNIRACAGRCSQPTKTYHGTVHARVLSLWLGTKTQKERRQLKEVSPSCRPSQLSPAPVLKKLKNGDLVPGLLRDVIAESCHCI